MVNDCRRTWPIQRLSRFSIERETFHTSLISWTRVRAQVTKRALALISGNNRLHDGETSRLSRCLEYRFLAHLQADFFPRKSQPFGIGARETRSRADTGWKKRQTLANGSVWIDCSIFPTPGKMVINANIRVSFYGEIRDCSYAIVSSVPTFFGGSTGQVAIQVSILISRKLIIIS